MDVAGKDPDQGLGEIIGTISINRDWYQCRSGNSSATPGTKTEAKAELTKVSVDISKTKGTNEFGYSKEDKIYTFTAKDGFKFNKVTKGTDAVWESKDNACGTKVIFIDERDKYVSILLTNNMFLLLHLEGNEWKDITKDRYDVSKVKFLGENDTELKSSDYTITIVDYSYRFTFKDGVKCKKIKYADVDVWKHSDDPKFESITAFDLGLVSNNFFVKNQSEFKKLDFKPTQPKATTVTKSEVEPEVKPAIVSQVSASLTSAVTTLTKVTLDIEKTESTNEFDYTDESGVVTYKPKDNHVFDKVSQGTKVVWQSTDIFGTLVRIKVTKNIKYLAMLLTNHTFILFHLENNEWKDITKDRYEVSKLKFFGDNDTEITKNDFSVNIVFLSYEFTFNTDVKCKKIKLGDDDVWKDTDDTKYSDIKSFSIGLTSNAFFVKNQSDQSKKVDFKPTQAKEDQESKGESEQVEAMVTPTIVSQVSTPLASVSKPAVTPIGVDIQKTQPTSDFEYTVESGVVTYKPKDNHVFNKVVDGTTSIWQSINDVFGTLVRTMTSNGVKYVAILHDNNMFKLFKQEGSEWTDITSKSHDITKLKFFGDNDTELKSTDYTVTIVDLSYTYIFNDGVMCKKVKLGEDDVWKHSDDPKFSEIKSFRLGLVSNTFYVLNNKNEFKKVDFKPTQTKGAPLTKGQSEVITPTSVPHTSLAILTEDAPAKASVTVIAPTGKPRPKKTPEVAAGPRTAITLNIGDKASNSAVDFKEDYLKNVMVFSAMEKYVFNKIVKTSGSNCCGSNCCGSETVIWEAKNKSEHFDTVYVDGLGTFSSTSNLSIHLCDGTFKHFNKSTFGGWSESPGVVDLDVRISSSNIQVDFFKKDNYRIYVAKPGYTIRKVVKSKKCSSDCCCSPKVIWEAHKEYALKVVLMGSKKEPKHLAVLLKNGELNLLFKGGKGKPWEDVTSTKNKITDLKMYAMAGDKSMELHKGHYSITLFNEFYGYLFYEGVGCVKVIHKDKTIWNLREERDFGCLKGAFLDLKSNKFNVMNDDDRCWVCEQVRKVNPVPLDVSSKASTDDFDFTVDHNRNINIYTSKGNAMFYQVVKKSSTNCCGSTCCGSEIVIWETEDPKGYATKVFADGLGACSSTKNVSIYLLNGDILHFSEGDNVWKKSDHKIVLELGKTSSTIGYDFVHQGESRTFTAKPGYLFKTVKLGSSWKWLVCGSSCCNSACLADDIFWEAETDEECSTKVTVYGVETNVKNINIFLKNNQVKHFHKANRKWVSKTSIVLDIEKNKDNDLFEYRSTRNFGHFNPKANLTISKIVKKVFFERVIWTAKPDDHGLKAVLMGSGKDEKFMSILLQSGNYVLLWKCGKGQPWEDITKEKSDFSGIKMYSLEEGTSKYHELTKTDYEPIIFESRYGYEFKDSVKCVKITYNDNLLWSHTEDAEFGYLKGLYLDLPKDQFSVTNLKDQTKQLTKPKRTTVTLDISKKETTEQYEYFKDGDCEKYSAKSGNVFEKIVDDTKTIWQSKDNVCGSLVRTKTKEDGIYLAILLTNNMFKLFKESDGTWNNITSQRSDITKLKFLGEDNEISSSDYEVTIVDYSYQFMFKGVVSCKKVMLGDVQVWNHSDDKKFGEIRKFQLGLVSNSFFVVNNKSESKKLTKSKVALDIENTESTNEFQYSKDVSGYVTYTAKDGHVFNKITQGTKDIWICKDDVFGTSVGVRTKDGQNYAVVLLVNGNFKLFQESGGNWTDITSSRFDVKMLQFYDKNDYELTSSNYTVQLLGHCKCSTISYLFDRGPKCKSVMYGNDIVWDETKCFSYKTINRFDFDPISNTFYAVKNCCDWKKIDYKPAERTKVSLDIDKTETTSEFDYSKDGDFQKYSVKSGHVFSKVSQGTKDIWVSKNNVFSTLVRTMTSNGVKYVAILHDNNMFKLFKQEGSEWKDITSKSHDITKLRFLGDNDVELSKSYYTVTIVDLSYTYIFKTGVMCKKVKLGEDDVWNHSDDPNFETIKSFRLGLVSNTFYAINNNNESKKLEFKPTPVTATVSTPLTSASKPSVTSVTADISKTQSTGEFEYTDENGVVTFKPKDNHVFDKVVDGTKVVWQSKENVYGILVRIKVTKSVKYLAVLLDNHMFSLFHEESGDWKDITKDRYDVSKLKFFGENDVELRASDYTVTIVFLSYEFTFNTGVKCKKIKLAHDDVWKDTDDTKYSDIKSFSLGLSSNTFFVKNQSDKSKKVEFKATEVTKVTVDIIASQSTDQFDYTDDNGVVTYKVKSDHVFSKITQGTTDIWEAKDDVNGILVRTKTSKGVKYLVVLLTNNMFTLFNEEAGKWQDVTSKRHDVKKLKFLGESDRELSKNDYTVTIVDLSFAYIFKDGVKCKTIMLGDDELWNHSDDTKFAEIKSFSLGLASNAFFVKNKSDQLKKIERPLEGESMVTPTIASQVSAPLASSVSPPKGTPVGVDISKTQTTNEFEYTDESGVITYKPKSGNVFNKVVEGTKVVWESTNDVFGTLVRIKVTKGVKYLAILLDNNMFTLFHEESGEWKDITKDRFDVSKVKFFGEGDSELSKTDYTVNISFLSYEFTFNDGVKCKKVKLGDDDVWKHTDDTNFADIKSFSLGLTSNNFFVKNQSDQSKKVDFKATQAKSTPEAKPTKPAAAQTSQAKPAEQAKPAPTKPEAKPAEQAKATPAATAAQTQAKPQATPAAKPAGTTAGQAKATPPAKPAGQPKPSAK
ncbi:SfiI-subtelomeric fragment related protein family member, putative [Theileria annulata]|uniref:SfiI-subtelomeric related protein family member, putative n=1 Tax=Theileria annulata TaxID=5874 RepID=Q4UC15_THEAN|nr:SfiI-subtelomeric fragment related protein family member, putative [Theileria annulata]CAI75636.1 SfiI-subtelomeric fragment related protein family member, putative [Theileria annulata]